LAAARSRRKVRLDANFSGTRWVDMDLKRAVDEGDAGDRGSTLENGHHLPERELHNDRFAPILASNKGRPAVLREAHGRMRKSGIPVNANVRTGQGEIHPRVRARIDQPDMAAANHCHESAVGAGGKILVDRFGWVLVEKKEGTEIIPVYLTVAPNRYGERTTLIGVLSSEASRNPAPVEAGVLHQHRCVEPKFRGSP
jgi:hypothetical protein